MPESSWTDDRIEQLRKLWIEGYSCSQIAAEIGGITRNAVIGKVHRLKLPCRDRTTFNVNGHTRRIDPTPPETPRAPPSKPRPKTVFKSREIKPRIRIPNPNASPPIMVAVSTITGQHTGAIRFRRPRIGEMTKDELRAMLTSAVQNTAAMEVIQ